MNRFKKIIETIQYLWTGRTAAQRAYSDAISADCIEPKWQVNPYSVTYAYSWSTMFGHPDYDDVDAMLERSIRDIEIDSAIAKFEAARNAWLSHKLHQVFTEGDRTFVTRNDGFVVEVTT